MKICVQGLWHLGVVTSAALTSLDFEVIALDYDRSVIKNLKSNMLPVEEPGVLNLLIKANLNDLIKYTDDPADIGECEIFWLAYDTPIDDEDNADTKFVISQFEKSLPFINNEAMIIISSQLPVGSARNLKAIANSQRKDNHFKFYVQPENLRLGKALESLLEAESIVIGTESGTVEEKLEKFYSQFKIPLIWMGIESAEMTKHAINSFLASSITFINEISDICESVGANSRDVEKGLRSDPRIGKKIYVSPGLGFAGGTLARDVKFLEKYQKNRNGIISSIIQSNQYNNNWVQRKFDDKFGQMKNLKIVFFGLTYTEGTSTLRRSSILDFATSLLLKGHEINYFEDQQIYLPDSTNNEFISWSTVVTKIDEVDLIVISRKMAWQRDLNIIKKILSSKGTIFDPSGLIFDRVKGHDKYLNYLTVGIKN
jgi:UDPglucose 6-dehydrogenase